MRVGVVLPVFNRPSLVVESLQAIADQDRPADQVVIVDDASSDDTAERVAQWIEGREGWSLIRLSENQGPSAARNRGIAELNDMDFVAFLDSDDLWPREHLARTERALDEEPAAVVIAADRLVAQKGGRSQLMKADWAGRFVLHGLIRQGGCAPSALVIRTAAIAQVGGFEESLRCHEDLELLLRLAEIGPFVRADGPPVSYRFSIASGEDEAGSLSAVSGDGAERRLKIIRSAFANHLTAARRQLLAWAYFRAARSQFKTGGSAAQARSYCWSAIRIAPWYIRPWFCLFRTPRAPAG